MDNEEIIRKANEAAFLLEHPLMNEALEEIEKRYTNLWKTSQYGNSTNREISYYVVAGLTEFKMQLKAYLDEVVRMKHNMQLSMLDE